MITRELAAAIDRYRTGNYGEDQYDDYFVCPICGDTEVGLLYRNDYKGKVVGCSSCISIIDND